MLVPQEKTRYVRSARLAARADGGAELAFVAWEAGGESIVVRPLDASGEPAGPERVAHRAPAIVALVPGVFPPAPSDDVEDEERARDEGHEVRIERARGGSRVIHRGPSGGERVVWQGQGTAGAPAVVADAGSAVVAFHHDVREDDGVRDVVSWVAVFRVAPDGSVHALPLPDVDRDGLGEEQGFTFPTLVALGGGALVLLGRGSHRTFAQRFDGRRWGARVPLPGDDGAWGCRGRRVAAARLADGTVLTARRERAGIFVLPLDLETLDLDAPPVPAAPRATRVPSPAHRRPVLHDGTLVLFGDLHQHSAHSDGTGNAHAPFERARWQYEHDFCALSDHESFCGKRIGPGEWRYLAKVTDAHDAPGVFATIHAYEWTARMFPGPGHKCVYLPHGDLPIVSRDDVPEGAALLAAVRAQGGIAVPHHVGWTGADLAAHDEHAQPVWEICSCHGCYEHPHHALGQRGELRDQLVDAALAGGLRFGFIACSDGHGLLFHHGVARKRDPFRTGLTAVHAEACTREAVLAAIRARRCYATSGAKIVLDVRDAGTGVPLLGAFVSGPRRVRVTARGTAPIAKLTLVGPGGAVLAEVTPAAPEAELVADVRAPFGYARVLQEDGEMAWGSPLFVTAATPSAG